MVDDTPEDAASAPDSGRARRAPPTIELEATEVSGTTKAAAATEAEAEAAASSTPEPEPEAEPAAPAAPAAPSNSTSISPSVVSPWIIAPFSGAVAASLVILVGWMLGWPKVLPPPAVPQVNTAAIDDLGKRVAGLEVKAGKPVAPATDPALSARLDSLQKSQASLLGDLSGLRAQEDKLAAAVNDLKSAPRDAAGAIDLSAVNERIAKIEDALRAQTGQDAKAADRQAQDDTLLRRVVAAALLDVAVRHGDPYTAALATAKSLAVDANALKPLEAFAATGVPAPPALNRELLALVPKLSPSAKGEATTGIGLVDRLQAGAAKLVRIERTDATGNDRDAVVARVTAAALRNDFAAARRELSSLSPADRAPAQGWLDKADARDAALAASGQFAEDAMASLAKPSQ
jgi:hypothetical protein